MVTLEVTQKTMRTSMDVMFMHLEMRKVKRSVSFVQMCA